MISDAERIGILRKRCLDRKLGMWRDACIPLAKSLAESAHVKSWQERRGLCTRAVLSQAVFEIDDLELLAGRLAPRPAGITDDDVASARKFLEQNYPGPGGQSGHCELDLRPIMELGIDGLAADIRGRLAKAGGESAEAYRSFLSALDGLARMIRNSAACARSAMAAAAPERQRELTQIAESCERLAGGPPRSFRDSVQILWFVTFAVQYAEDAWLVGPGHIDRTLYRFYAADIAAGRLTRDEALVLVESLYLLVNELIWDGLAVPVMVGGRNASGADLTNDLSYLCLEALRRTKLVYPTVGVCWHEGTPRALVDLAVDLISKGYSTPALFGDETIQRGLKALGVPAAQSCNYINSTCVEITPVGASSVWVTSPYYNTCGLLLEEIAARAGSQPASYEEFKKGYFERLRAAVEKGAKEQNETRSARRLRGRKPLQSIFTRDCLDRGRDIDDGGAVYNWVECSFVGLANLADSLYVLREEVFASRRKTLAGLKELLDADFKGHEAERLRLLNSYPKYGQDNPEVDAIVGEVVAAARAICSGFRMLPDESPYVPGAFVWAMHEVLGRETGATPDGRRRGTPLADGAGPAQGRESRGPTAAILSTTAWDHSPLIGGVAFNMKFNTTLFAKTPRSAGRLAELILSYLRRGGFEIQINVVDREKLKKARECPEDYRDLVVRIGGYTDYFTRLSPEMQDEIMLRTEYGSV